MRPFATKNFINLYLLNFRFMWKKLFILTIVFAWVNNLLAQDDETPVIDINKTVIDTTPAMKKPKLSDKVDFNVSMGSSFLYAKGFGNGLATYVAPELKYKFTPRFHLNAGVMIVNSNYMYNKYLPFYQEPSVVFRSKPATSVLGYVSGDYLLSEKLTISGMVMRDLSNPQLGRYNSSISAMSLRMDYKITNNISIGAGMHMSQGGYFNSHLSNGFSPGNYYNPLFNY